MSIRTSLRSSLHTGGSGEAAWHAGPAGSQYALCALQASCVGIAVGWGAVLLSCPGQYAGWMGSPLYALRRQYAGETRRCVLAVQQQYALRMNGVVVRG